MVDREKTAAAAAGAIRGRRALFVRRGLVALAAGVLAGVSTKLGERTAEAADNDPMLVGNTYTSTLPTRLTGAVASGFGTLNVSNSLNRAILATTSSSANAIRADSNSGAAIFATSVTNAGLWGQASNSTGLIGISGSGTGMFGQGGGSSPGMYGVSTNGPGVRGDAGYDPANGQPNGNAEAAVLGNSTGNGPGARGVSTSGMGVSGESTNNTGVYGISNVGIGVYGTSTSSAGVWGNSTNSIGVFGNGTTGVFGQSATGIGVTATTTSGVALRANGRTELYGDVEIGDFETQPPNGSSPAYNLNVTGELRVNGQKLAIVRGADGDYRKFYCVESAESYFEDFGTVKMSGGHVRVAIPEDFREFVAPERGFYIQLTPMGANNGLFVSNKDVMGFDITEANGGKSELDVQYRIVARRRDVTGDRLARVRPTELRPHEKRVPANHSRVPEESVRQNTERRRTEVAPPPTLPAPPSDSQLPSAPERRSR